MDNIWSIYFLLFLNYRPGYCKESHFDLSGTMRRINEQGDVLDSIMKQYNKHIRPPPARNSDSSAIRIQINLTIIDYNFKVESNRLDITFDLQESWEDSWLSYSGHASLMVMRLGPELSDHIWHPKLRFLGNHAKKQITVMKPNVLITKYGIVNSRKRVQILSNCEHESLFFPLRDSYECEFEIGSESMDPTDLLVGWIDRGRAISHLNNGSGRNIGNIFDLKNITFKFNKLTKYQSTSILFNLQFQKNCKVNVLLKLYLPTVILAVMLQATLLLNRNMTGLKIGLIGINLIVQTAYYYLTKLVSNFLTFWDIWMLYLICSTILCFIFLCFLNRMKLQRTFKNLDSEDGQTGCCSDSKIRSRRPSSESKDFFWTFNLEDKAVSNSSYCDPKADFDMSVGKLDLPPPPPLTPSTGETELCCDEDQRIDRHHDVIKTNDINQIKPNKPITTNVGIYSNKYVKRIRLLRLFVLCSTVVFTIIYWVLMLKFV